VSLKKKKSKRTKFGMFRKKEEALAELERRKSQPQQKGYTYFFNTMKLDRGKERGRIWLAYCLKRKEGR